MARWKRNSPPRAQTDRHTETERQLAIGALRMEVLETATLYGLARRHPDTDQRDDPEWLDWINYTKGIEVWLRGHGSAEELDRQIVELDDLAPASLHSREAEAREQDWRQRLEGLAEACRTVEEVGGEPLSEVSGAENRGGVALLGAVEDSLVLQLTDDQEDAAMRADSDEIYELLLAARGDGTWRFMEPQPTATSEQALLSPEPAGADITERASELIGLLGQTWSDTLSIHRQLKLDGRELTDDERAEAQQRLRAGAVCLRLVQLNRPSIDRLLAMDAPDLSDLDRTIVVLRVMQRSLVLAISDQPVLRERAILLRRLEALNVQVRRYWLAVLEQDAREHGSSCG